MNSEQVWRGNAAPLIFLRPIGIAAGDAMRLMELAKRLDSSVRWRMAPPGVSADAYLVHRFSVAQVGWMPDLPAKRDAMGFYAAQSDSSFGSDYSSSKPGVHQVSLDAQGWHRGRPVCVLGKDVDTSELSESDLAPLNFPDVLQEVERGLDALLSELVGARMLYSVGSLAWEQRTKWPTHRLHAIEAGQLLAVIDTQNWQFYLRDGCSVERMADADMVPMPSSSGFAAEGFHSFMFEAALWELAKRCPEPLLHQMLPSTYLTLPLTHRRIPHLKEHALGDHCVAILRALDTSSRSADELQTSLRLPRPALLRALTCLALVRAIRPESRSGSNFLRPLRHWWSRITS